MNSQIFISYAHDSQHAKNFIALMKYAIDFHNHSATSTSDVPKFTIWTDRHIPAGSMWSKDIDEAIRQSFAVIVAISPEANDSHYVTYEWAFAMGLQHYVVPIVLEPEAEKMRLFRISREKREKSRKSDETRQVEQDALKQMSDLRDAIASALDRLDLVI